MTSNNLNASLYISILLLSAAMLGFEVNLTRWLSISQWSHFAYLIISIALLGIASAGTAVAIYKRLRDIDSCLLLMFANLAAAIFVLLSYFLTGLLPFDEARLAWDKWQWLYIAFYYIWLGLPFFASGVALAHIFLTHHKIAGRVYFFNLVGSAAGCLGILPLLNHLPPNEVLKWIAVIYLLAAAICAVNNTRRWAVAPFAIAIITISILPSHYFIPPIEMSPYKALPLALTYPDSSHLISIPHSHGRLDVVSSPAARFAPGLSLTSKQVIPPQLGLTTDGNRMNAITLFEGDNAEVKFVEDLPTSWLYNISDIESALVIAPGGGLDVLTALYYDTGMIDAIQSHPRLQWLIDMEFGDFSGRIYSLPNVRFYPLDPRAFLNSSDSKWDAIVLSQAENPSATSTGMYGITENYLLTKQAFLEYLKHLSDDGWVTVTRYLLPPPREGIRIVSLAADALKSMGANPSAHVIAFRSWGTITVAAKRDPIESSEIERLKTYLANRQFDLVYYPGMTEDEANRYNLFDKPYYYRLVHNMLTTDNLKEFYSKNIFDLKPTTDEKPFFFFFFPLKNAMKIYETVQGKWQALIDGGYLIYAVLAQAIIISLVIIILPLVICRYRDLKSSLLIRQVIYFTMIGLAYMIVEIVFIQYGILFLGNPTYAVALVIAAMLLSSGIGSLVSSHFESTKRYMIASASLCVFILIASKVMTRLIVHTTHTPWITAVLLFSLILPFGFLMGIPFPVGIKLVGKTDPRTIPWCCAFNGAASVIGAVLAVVLALGIGFSNILIVAALCYMVAGLTLMTKRMSS